MFVSADIDCLFPRYFANKILEHLPMQNSPGLHLFSI